MAPLVSIIIPCYNASLWLREAIESCLQQTYTPVEIIVIDDGSTDDSLKVLHSYGSQIILESGPNRGGNYARNRGFTLSRGAYIQFLDADDYLLPPKIARQVAFLEETGADVVYGDWRHQFHEAQGIRLGPVKTAGLQQNVLTSLLRNWWVSPAAVLYRREAVLAGGGWDESLTAAQDRDFFIQVALAGADIRYQPGCYAVYRRHGSATVSTGNRARWLQNHEVLLNKVQVQLRDSDGLTEANRRALALSYFQLARNYYGAPERAKQQQLYAEVLALDPGFKPQESRLYTTTYGLLGFEKAEWFAHLMRRVRMRHG